MSKYTVTAPLNDIHRTQPLRTTLSVQAPRRLLREHKTINSDATPLLAIAVFWNVTPFSLVGRSHSQTL